ncbi:MAG TPA: hypothetical protein VFU88_05445 [Ktedonobacterales bacterium]|nr:hypothetical protein [Ktedonobacterales bacterium]
MACEDAAALAQCLHICCGLCSSLNRQASSHWSGTLDWLFYEHIDSKTTPITLAPEPDQCAAQSAGTATSRHAAHSFRREWWRPPLAHLALAG